MKAGDRELPHRGQYRVIDSYDTLEFSWLSEFAGAESVVRLSFKELSADETEVTLRHIGLPGEDAAKNHEEGWGSILDALVRHLS